MGKYWLLDQHGGDGPTALVETDGGMHIVDVLRFGPTVTELEAQQEVWDHVIGKLAPTMKPMAEASSIDEEGIAPHPELPRGEHGDGRTSSRAGRGDSSRGPNVGRTSGGPSRKRSRGDR